MQNKNRSKHMSQTENLFLWWSETGKIHLKSPWMLWCCAQFNINLPRSIPNPYLHVLHYALCFGRAHSSHSGDFSQLPVILVQDWFRWKIWKQIGNINICWPLKFISYSTEGVIGASGRESLIWVWIFITSTDWIITMDVTELSIHRLCLILPKIFCCCYRHFSTFCW